MLSEPNQLEYSVIASDIEECKSVLDHLAADNPEGGGPALWRRMPSLPAAQGSQSVHPQTHLIRTQL
jgi:hypothetical protein